MTDEEKKALIQYRITKAKDTYCEIALLIDHQLWNTAINRLYYACYYAVSALLIKYDVQAQTHAGTRRMFGLNFIKPRIVSQASGKLYSNLFDKRQTGDYEDFIDHTQEDVEALVQPAQKLIQEIELLLNNE
jgi:uncharacterized protein (UPF0332 family)